MIPAKQATRRDAIVKKIAQFPSAENTTAPETLLEIETVVGSIVQDIITQVSSLQDPSVDDLPTQDGAMQASSLQSVYMKDSNMSNSDVVDLTTEDACDETTPQLARRSARPGRSMLDIFPGIPVTTRAPGSARIIPKYGPANRDPSSLEDLKLASRVASRSPSSPERKATSSTLRKRPAQLKSAVKKKRGGDRNPPRTSRYSLRSSRKATQCDDDVKGEDQSTTG